MMLYDNCLSIISDNKWDAKTVMTDMFLAVYDQLSDLISDASSSFKYSGLISTAPI